MSRNSEKEARTNSIVGRLTTVKATDSSDKRIFLIVVFFGCTKSRKLNLGGSLVEGKFISNMFEGKEERKNRPMISRLLVKKLTPTAILPKKGSALAAGYDICADEETVVPARGKAKVSTGLSWMCPPNTYGRVAPRSVLTWKNSINVGAGVIDEDYRGEVCVILFNHGDSDFHVKYFSSDLGKATASLR